MIPWPWQTRGVAQALAALASGQRRICLCAPTGAGKTWMIAQIAEAYLMQSRPVILYSNRQAIIDQTSAYMTAQGMLHGVRSAQYEPDLAYLFQIASLQTEISRSTKRKTRELHRAELVLVDEAHANTGEETRRILSQHLEEGASIVGFTATPVELSDCYDILLCIASVSECREGGALVRAHHFAPDEPDYHSWLRRNNHSDGQAISEAKSRSLIMTNGIFGRVWEWFEKLNPLHKPTILFAPDVEGSIWFAEQFSAKGVRSAHIDGQDVWLDGKQYRTSRQLREDVLKESKNGRVSVLCNRFVLREGIDAPWLAHGIFATVFGSIPSYLQSGGRLLRAHPSLESVTIQDHGGNWWRYGSLNDDRVWSLGDTANLMYRKRAEHLRQNPEEQPRLCPNCQIALIRGRCPNCQHEVNGKRSRPVVSSDGVLKEVSGDVFAPRRTYQQPNGPALWERMYWRSQTKKGKRTFYQAMALFARENYFQWPSLTWPFMPLDEADLGRRVADVGMDLLIPKP